MMNQDNPYAMNQTCKVCGEPAAGFHFGAFTCEGCKSFFGRSYNNLSSIADCKNNGECIINKKNRTACKACRLRKCILVGMSKSGSRYGRRSNWFKIHCLLQEQQQQQQAALAAHHNQQAQQQHHHHHHHQTGQHIGQGPGQKQPVAAAALSMLGHPAGAAAAYPGLFPPRTKEELMMLGLEEYAAAKHSATVTSSPSVSSPDSHNSDSSMEVNVRSGGGNPLLHLSGKHATTSAIETAAAAAAAAAVAAGSPQLRKDLPPFLPLHFPGGLASMPVMPPPAFLPPPHLLIPGYHHALYAHPHHQGLLKSMPEQQKAAAAAAMQQLFSNSSSAAAAAAAVVGSAANNQTTNMAARLLQFKDDQQMSLSKSTDITTTAPSGTIPVSPTFTLSNNNNHNNNNNNFPNGSKVSEDYSTRFYFDAMLKPQRARRSSPPATTPPLMKSTAAEPPAVAKHDHSISALFKANSECSGEWFKSRQENKEYEKMDDGEAGETATSRPPNGEDSGAESDCDEDLVVSMTPPRSPATIAAPAAMDESESNPNAQDDPIDLSMKAGGDIGGSGGGNNVDGEICDNHSRNAMNRKTLKTNDMETSPSVASASSSPNRSGGESGSDKCLLGYNSNDCDIELEVDDDDTSTVETVKSVIHNHNNNNNNNIRSDNNQKCKKRKQLTDEEAPASDDESTNASKRKFSKIIEMVELEVERAAAGTENKCVQLLIDAENINNNIEQKLLKKVSPLDLTTKV